MLDPWSYEQKYLATRTAESASQKALFMYANMAANFGLKASNIPDSYSFKNWAKLCLEDNIKNGTDDRIPQLKCLFAIHNQGHGDAIRGAHAVAEGLKAGVPDVCLPVVTWFGGQEGDLVGAGLYIELKRKLTLKPGQRKLEVIDRVAGKASTKQEEWQSFLREQGYVCEICYGFEEARDLILKYLREGGLI